MILPALRSALDKARAISCTSNQKQLGTATFLYVDDNKGFLPSDRDYYSSSANDVHWPTFLWSYTTHQPITSNFAYLKLLPDGTYEPKLSMFRCTAVLEPFKVSVEMKHIGMNAYLSQAPSYKPNLFITKCRWPSARMLYADYSGRLDEARQRHQALGDELKVQEGYLQEIADACGTDCNAYKASRSSTASR